MKNKISLPLLASIAALTPLAVDMYLPGIPAIADELNTGISIIQNSLSIFLVGFGLGMLVFGPCADRFGRRPLAIFGLISFALTSYLVSISTSASMFLFVRLLQGFLGSAATVVIPAMIRDCYGKNTAKGMSSVTMIMLLAPLVAPLIGSFLLRFGDWKTIFHFLTAYALVILSISILYLKETRPVDHDTTPPSFFGNYKIILSKHAIYLDLLCYMLCAFAFFTYLTSASFIYITYFGVSETLFGVLFAGTASALICGNFINIRNVNRFGPRKMMQAAIAASILFSALLCLVSLSDLGLYWTLACFVLIIGSVGIASVNSNALILLEFPNQASSASAVTGTLRFGTGALAGPILVVIYNGSPVPIAIMIFISMLAAGIAQLIRKS